jgi:hypothetical protein
VPRSNGACWAEALHARPPDRAAGTRPTHALVLGVSLAVTGTRCVGAPTPAREGNTASLVTAGAHQERGDAGPESSAGAPAERGDAGPGSAGASSERGDAGPEPVDTSSTFVGVGEAEDVRGVAPRFRRVLGAVRVGPGAQGDYASAFTVHVDRYINTETSFSSAIEARFTLGLAQDGAAAACFASRESHRSSIGRYASADAKDHGSYREERILGSSRGRWIRSAGGWLDVQFDTIWGNVCPAPATGAPVQSFGPLPLRCVELENNDVLPAPVLACKLRARVWLSLLDSLFLGFGAETPPKGWLILGRSPGARIDWLERGDADDPVTPSVRVTEGSVTLVPSHWMK